MSIDTSIPNLVTLTITQIDLNSRAKPRFLANASMTNFDGNVTMAFNTLAVVAPSGTPATVSFQLANSSFSGVVIEDTGGGTPPVPFATIFAKLVGLVIPYNNKSLGATPHASQFATIANPHNEATVNVTIDGNTYSVAPLTTLVIDHNTEPSVLGHPWRFALYVYYSFEVTTGGNSTTYSGTAYWDPYVDNENEGEP